jgi:hypothetical protein
MTSIPMTRKTTTRIPSRLLGSLTLAACLAGSPALAQSPSSFSLDNRIAINVSQAEKNHVLTEMREFLHGFHSINLALARQDMKVLALTARPMGPLLERLPESLRDRLPEEFTQLAIAMNEAFQNLARNAEQSSDMKQTHENLAEVMTYCSGCHDTYRFNVIQKKSRK